MDIAGGEEEVQVFGRTPDSGMHLNRESARNNIRDATAIQYHQRFPKHRFLLERKLRLPRRTHRKFKLISARPPWMSKETKALPSAMPRRHLAQPSATLRQNGIFVPTVSPERKLPPKPDSPSKVCDLFFPPCFFYFSLLWSQARRAPGSRRTGCLPLASEQSRKFRMQPRV